MENFFSTVTWWHRWFKTSGENCAAARAITGVCNLIFLFLILSGLYLWLPKTWQWIKFKIRLFLDTPPNSKARDFNWHHVFGIWCAIPLAIIVATATVFNYSLANNLVYQVYGEEAPQRGQTPTNQLEKVIPEYRILGSVNYLNLDEFLSSA